jgi:hypothetical protein
MSEECSSTGSTPELESAFDLLRQPRDPVLTAVVYRVRLDRIDSTDVLYNVCYIGQAVRVGSAAEVAKARWAEEVGQAARKDKQIGFIAVLDAYGEEAFTWEIVDSFRGTRSKAQAWADAREVEEIAKHGGPLRDMDKRIKQTFNQTKGGKGNGWWEGIDAFRSKLWNVFAHELEAFVTEHWTAYVPKAYVNSLTKYRLGKQVFRVRRGHLLKGHPREAERRAFLDSLPRWAWNATKTEEYSQQKSAITKERHAREELESPGRQSRRSREILSRPEVKAKHRASVKAACARPEVKAKKSASAKVSHARPEVKAKKSASAKAQAKREEAVNPGCHKRRSKECQNRPEVKAKKSASLKVSHARPEVKAKLSENAKAYAKREEAANPGARKKRLRDLSRRPEVQDIKRLRDDAKRQKKEDEQRATLSDADFKKWKHTTDMNRRATEKKMADAHTIRSVFPEAVRRDVSKHRKDGTLAIATALVGCVHDMITRLEVEAITM